MLNRIFKTSNKLGLLIAGVMLGGLTSYAVASIPDASGVINACYGVGGAVRIVQSSTDCAATETHLTWSQTGPQGPTGPTGATGATGPQGPAGAPLAFAYIEDDGTIDTSISSNVTSVSRVDDATGAHYCFNLAVSPKNVVATKDGDAEDGGSIHATLAGVGDFSGSLTTICGASADAMITHGGGAFYIQFN